MRLKFVSTWKFRFLAIWGIATLLLVALAPNAPPSAQYSNPASITRFKTAGTTLLVRGYSPYDPYDRVVLILDNGIEVARLITPLHRNGQLPNSFADIVQLPYSANGNNLTWSILDTGALWSVSIQILARSNAAGHINPIYVDTTTGLIPLQAMTGIQGDKDKIFVPFNETVYFLVSGHSALESVDDLTITVDGTSYPVFNWHPLNNDFQLTTVGASIPYINMSLTAGYHTLILTGSPRFLSLKASYFIVSAFGICSQCK